MILSVSFEEQNPEAKLVFKKKIGSGTACEVYLAAAKYSVTNQYAVRILEQKTENLLQALKKEIALMKMCKSKHVLDYY